MIFTPRVKIFTELQLFIGELGYTLPETADATATRIETDWIPGSYNSRSQLVITLTDLALGGCRLQILVISQGATGTADRTRREDYEWDLIERVEPDRALQSVRRANQRGNEVHEHNQRRWP